MHTVLLVTCFMGEGTEPTDEQCIISVVIMIATLFPNHWFVKYNLLFTHCTTSNT
jgi:hypothetical protein